MAQIVIELNRDEMLGLLRTADASGKSEEVICREAILRLLSEIDAAKGPRPDWPVLASEPEWEARRLRLEEPHIRQLTQFVLNLRYLRKEQGLPSEIPFFDPAGGGVNAEALFILEAPGPVAVSTGFVSYDNPDPTARNFSMFLKEAGIKREQTLMWNIVPWYLGDGGKIRPPRAEDIRGGLKYLEKLMDLLQLKAVVCVGSHSKRAINQLNLSPKLRRFNSPHTSATSVNTRADCKDQIISEFRKVSSLLKS